MGNNISDIKLRRMLSFLFDLIFILLLAFTVYMFLGIVFKIDSVGFQNITFPLLLILITGYLFFGEIFINNTLGKYLTGIGVSDRDMQGKPSVRSLVKRGVIKILFPVEGMVLLFSKNNRRLGDIWANTVVVRKESAGPNAAFGFVTGIAVIIFLVFIFRVSMGLAVKRTDFYNAGISYLTSSGKVKINGMVKVVEQTRNNVNFIVPVSNDSNDRYAIIYLRKSDKEWIIERTSFIKEHILGFSYGFSN